MTLQLDDLETKITPADPPEQLPKTPVWKKIILAGVMLAFYVAFVLMIFLGEGSVKLIGLLLMIAYVCTSGLLIKALKKLLKFAVFPD